MHAIEVNGLEKRFGEILALDHVSFTVETGEVFGYLGPNGAGKTTTIRILTGITAPTGGSATIFGWDIVRDTTQARRKMGIVYETSNVYDDITAWQNMMFAGELYHVGRIDREERGKELLEIFGLWDRRASRVKGFSKGMKRRLTLAMGLIRDPTLLFLDEPTSGLDPVGRREVRDIIHDLRAQGVTVFLNSHFLSEVEVTCDRVAIVKRGRVVRAGTLDELTGGATEVEIRAGGLTAELVAGLARWGRVVDSRGTAENGQGDDITRLMLTVDQPDALPAIADYLVTGGARLYALAPQRLPLEELFMRVMREEEPAL